MERQQHSPESPDPWLNTWDEVPRDGPAVFVIDCQAYDKRCVVRGRWIDPNSDAAVLEAELTELLGGAPEPNSWAVISQIGLGPAMVDEQLLLSELSRLQKPEETGRVDTDAL